MSMLHTFSDGSTLSLRSVKELIQIPVWKGNRIMDRTHVANIQADIGNNIQCLDSSIFRVVTYYELDVYNNAIAQSYLIDGQHRAYILRTHFEETLCERDFVVPVIEKHVESETEAIEYFNMLNNVKPMQWEQDPRQLANKYVVALCDVFGKEKKNQKIRPGATKRPFLSADLLREVLELHVKQLKTTDSAIARFVSKVQEWNRKKLEFFQLQLLQAGDKQARLLQSALDRGFALAYDQTLPWIRECLG